MNHTPYSSSTNTSTVSLNRHNLLGGAVAFTQRTRHCFNPSEYELCGSYESIDALLQTGASKSTRFAPNVVASFSAQL